MHKGLLESLGTYIHTYLRISCPCNTYIVLRLAELVHTLEGGLCRIISELLHCMQLDVKRLIIFYNAQLKGTDLWFEYIGL